MREPAYRGSLPKTVNVESVTQYKRMLAAVLGLRPRKVLTCFIVKFI
jgi:hypothetical protein